MDFLRSDVHTTTLTATLDAPTIQAILEAAVRDKAGIAPSQPGVTLAVGLHVTNDVLSAAVEVQVDHLQVGSTSASPTPA